MGELEKMFRILLLTFAFVKSTEQSFWEKVMADNKCLEAKWFLSNWDNEMRDALTEFKNRDAVLSYCESNCGATKCDELKSEDFVSADTCLSIKSGDLKDSYQKQVLDKKDSNMIATMNILCDNISLECSYAMTDYWNTINAKGKADATKEACLKKCGNGQKYDQGLNDMMEPCSDSLMHSLSMTIILIIS